MTPDPATQTSYRRLPWKQRIDDFVSKSPLQAAFWRVAGGRLAVLAYHGVDDPEQFAAHMDVIRTSTQPVSLDDVIGAVESGQPLPPHSTLVTFDDGRVSVRDSGVALLRERGIPGIAFVNPGLLDSSMPYWWDEVAELAMAGAGLSGMPAEPGPLTEALKRVPNQRRLELIADLRAQRPERVVIGDQMRSTDLGQLEVAGIAVGNHSLTHPCLDQCTTQEIDREVEEGHRLLTDALGHPPRAFAYPNGNFDQRTVDAVERTGYPVAFAWDHRLGPRLPANRLLIPRVRVNSTTPITSFRTILSGLHPAFLRLASALRRS
jgi:peptidoglycan/xylan/chitin deacetylase (PgdA/CDA1 family)